MALGVGAAVGLISPSPTGRSERIWRCYPGQMPAAPLIPRGSSQDTSQPGKPGPRRASESRTRKPRAGPRDRVPGSAWALMGRRHQPLPARRAGHSARALPSRELSRDSPYPSGGFAGGGVYPGLPAAAQGPGARPPPALTRGSRAGLAPRAPHARVSPSPSLPSPWAAALPTPLCTRGSRGPERSTQHSRSHRRQVAGLGSEAGMWP